MKKALPIIVVTWIVSLLTTLAFVYADPSLFQLQAKYDQDQYQTKIIRLYEPSEKNITNIWAKHPIPDTVDFSWTPDNSDNNAILEIYVYLEYYYENPPQTVWDGGLYQWELSFKIAANGFYDTIGGVSRMARSQTSWEEQGSFEWTQTPLFVVQPAGYSWVTPNQENYDLTFEVRLWYGGEAHTCFRNVNVVLEVIDGIPAA